MALTGFVQANSPDYLSDSLLPEYAVVPASNQTIIHDFNREVANLSYDSSPVVNWTIDATALIYAVGIFTNEGEIVEVDPNAGSTTQYGGISNIAGQNTLNSQIAVMTDPQDSNIAYIEDYESGNPAKYYVRKIELDTYNVLDEYVKEISNFSSWRNTYQGKRRLICTQNGIAGFYQLELDSPREERAEYFILDKNDLSEQTHRRTDGNSDLARYVGMLAKKSGGAVPMWNTTDGFGQEVFAFDLENNSIEGGSSVSGVRSRSPQQLHVESIEVGSRYVTFANGGLNESTFSNSRHELRKVDKFPDESTEKEAYETVRYPRGGVLLHSQEFQLSPRLTRFDDFNNIDSVNPGVDDASFVYPYPAQHPRFTELWNAEVNVKNEIGK